MTARPVDPGFLAAMLGKAVVPMPTRTTRGTEFVHEDQRHGGAGAARQGERT
jgi:hypothetical protein